MKTKTLINREFDKCMFCGDKKNLNIHHRRYRSKKGNSLLFHENKYDLIVLCRDCHHLWHELMGKKIYSKKIYSIIGHFVKFDHMDKREAILFVTSKHIEQ
jgi:hypothetical protein